MPNPRDKERVGRERDFHNALYGSDGTRSAQGKYYWAINDGEAEFKRICQDLARGKDVLEYGCGDTRNFLTMGPIAKSLHAIDISEEAIERLKSENPHENVALHVMDAMNMTFADNSFDLVFGSGIVHHLDTEASAQEVARVLRPGGRAVFLEPLGHNPIINIYRRLTPQARTSDEHPLVPKDFVTISTYLELVDIRHYGLTTLAVVPLRKRKAGEALWGLARRIDKALFALPGVKQLAWYVLVVGAKQPEA